MAQIRSASRLTTTNTETRDIAVVQGISLLLVTVFVVVNLLADLICAMLDPRLALRDSPR